LALRRKRRKRKRGHAFTVRLLPLQSSSSKSELHARLLPLISSSPHPQQQQQQQQQQKHTKEKSEMGEPAGMKVSIHLYDLSQGMARAMSAPLLGKQLDGIWHTGIVAFGQEFYFGGGIQCGHPGGTHFGRPLQVVELGETHLPREVFDQFLVEISPRFSMQTYNLLRHNCNNFSNEVANFLVGSGIPQHILDLPNDVLSTPFGQQMMPMLNMMDAQMRTASEQGAGGGGQFGAWTPPTAATAAPAAATPTAASEAAAPWRPAAAASAEAPATTTEAASADARRGAAAAAESRAKAALEAAIKAEFTRLVAEGMGPNEAAAEAVKAVKARAQ
jgi:hypothetical protein